MVCSLSVRCDKVVFLFKSKLDSLNNGCNLRKYISL